MKQSHFETLRVLWAFGPDAPEEAVEVSVPHVLEDHGQQLPVGADAVETHDVLVLEDRQQLRLPLEVLPGGLVGVLQGLTRKEA